jgi:UDP-N-acetylglucosamine--N-acetylmuramyl-(pentapeptide) pyrophosphoryl-undecaprenol N-acetylglucosamine transferase
MRLPSLLVPFPAAADNHQWHNARAFEETGAAQLLEQREATPEKVSLLLREFVDDAAERNQMKAALARWHAPKAAEHIAERILRSLARPVGTLDNLSSGLPNRGTPEKRSTLKSSPVA